MDPVPPPSARWERGMRERHAIQRNKKLIIGARALTRGLVARNVTVTINTSIIAGGRFVEGASFFGYAHGTLKGAAANGVRKWLRFILESLSTTRIIGTGWFIILYQNWLVSNTRPTARLKFDITKLDAKPAPTVTEFGSRGPSPTFPSVLKPDIMGPGFQILAAWLPNVQAHTSYFKDLYTGFNLLTGTSMACPHLDGVATLIKKAHPDWSPAAIRSAMMTTSDAVDHSGQPIQDSGPDQSPTTGFDMGAGQVSPNKALEPGLVYDLNSSDYVNLLCAMNFTTAQIRAITRSHHSTGSCNNICATPSLDLNYPSFIANFAADRSNQVLEFRRTLTNVGCEMATYKASVTSFDGLEVRVVPTVLAFKAKGDMLGFKLVIEYAMKKMRNPFLKLGYLRWIEVGGGNHVVQSPIVATNMNSL